MWFCFCLFRIPLNHREWEALLSPSWLLPCRNLGAHLPIFQEKLDIYICARSPIFRYWCIWKVKEINTLCTSSTLAASGRLLLPCVLGLLPALFLQRTTAGGGADVCSSLQQMQTWSKYLPLDSSCLLSISLWVIFTFLLGSLEVR